MTRIKEKEREKRAGVFFCRSIVKCMFVVHLIWLVRCANASLVVNLILIVIITDGKITENNNNENKIERKIMCLARHVRLITGGGRF